MNIYSISASEFLSGALRGKYGPNNLVVDNLLSAAIAGQIQELPEGSTDLRFRVSCRISLEVDFSSAPHLVNLVDYAEFQVLQGKGMNGILRDAIDRYFYHHLIGDDELDELMCLALDGIIQHLVYFCKGCRHYELKDVIH